MNFWWILVIVLLVILLPLIITAFIKGSETLGYICGIIIIVLMCLSLVCITKTVKIKQESVRQLKERQQIEYQISMLDNENIDKVKLNEWILTYNDWINDVNTSKEQWGIFSFYYGFDMSQHTIIDLV